MIISRSVEAEALRRDHLTVDPQGMRRAPLSWAARDAVIDHVADRQLALVEFHRAAESETADAPVRTAVELDLHARIERAAFEAAYMEMANPDPASSRFVALVAAHRERLWAMHRTCRGERRTAGDGRLAALLMADSGPLSETPS